MEKKLGYQLETDDSEDDSVNNRPLTANIKKGDISGQHSATSDMLLSNLTFFDICW